MITDAPGFTVRPLNCWLLWSAGVSREVQTRRRPGQVTDELEPLLRDVAGVPAAEKSSFSVPCIGGQVAPL